MWSQGENVDLAALHGGEGGAVGVLCYAGAAAGVHGDGGVREGGAEEQRIGEDADVRAEPHQLDLRRFAGESLRKEPKVFFSTRVWGFPDSAACISLCRA